MSRPRVAFVVQRCGEDVAGGAERLCLEMARRMQPDWDVEILTTCARDARTWADAYEPGSTHIAGVPARRFRVREPRRGRTFDRLSERLAAGRSTVADQEAWMRAQGPYAPELVAELASHAPGYERVLFFSYLYATTYFGLPPVAARAVLVPLAHDEWTLALPLFRSIFSAARQFAFVSEEERALVGRRFAGTSERGEVVGVGIEAPLRDAGRFRAKYGLTGELLLCVGRVEEAKGSAELIDYFCALQEADPQERTLVLLGPVAMKVPRRRDIVALGQVAEADKWDALAAAAFVCVPSAYESLSLAALEAWAAGAAVLANGASAVMVGQCRRANGGLWYATRHEFVELARSRLFGRAEDLGRSGARYVAREYTWAAVRERLRRLLMPGAAA